MTMREDVSEKTDEILMIVSDLESDMEALRSELDAERARNEEDGELLSQFVREARRAVRGSETIITAGRGDYREFYRLLEAVEKIDWIEK